MNMVKAMLVSKNISFEEIHGIKSHNLRGVSKKITLCNEGVKILKKGILSSLSLYLNETSIDDIYSLEELLYNIPCIHRTFCLTYKTVKDLFIPLTNCEYQYDSSNNVYCVAKVTSEFVDNKLSSILPESFEMINTDGTIRSIPSISISNPNNISLSDVNQISDLNTILRKDLQYINGAAALWYVKCNRCQGKRIGRYGLTIMVAVMHRLSELCRYKPIELSAFLEGQKNWLISEFINMTSKQFLDEIASEITGHQFLIPNIRQAS